MWLIDREKTAQKAGLGGCGGGGILGDDMGMGKTIQMLALIYKQATRETECGPGQYCAPHGSTLVVCPQSVLYNWKRETERWLGWTETSSPHACVVIPKLSVVRKSRCKSEDTFHAEKGRGGDRSHVHCRASLVITTYETIDLDHQASSVFQRVYWRRIILDEAHRIRNAPKSCECLYSLQAWSRWACTGTLFHNGLEDVANVARFLKESPYDRPSWWRRHRFDHSAISAWKSKYYLSRDKSILSLAPVIYNMIVISLDEQARATYNQMLKAALSRYIQARSAAGTRQQRQAAMSIVLGTIREMRQFCNHELLPFGKDCFFEHIDRVAKGHGHSGRIFNASKLGFVVKAVADLAASDPGCKMVVFSQWKRTLQALHCVLSSLHGIKCTEYHGSLSAHEKQAQIDSFCDSSARISVILVSLRAGGVGINLSCAKHVFMVDGWYNPFLEAQAIDRVNRIGQTNEKVFCHRFHVKHSVEDDIANIQGLKRTAAEQFYSGCQSTTTTKSMPKVEVTSTCLNSAELSPQNLMDMISFDSVDVSGISIHKIFGQLMRTRDTHNDKRHADSERVTYARKSGKAQRCIIAAAEATGCKNKLRAKCSARSGLSQTAACQAVCNMEGHTLKRARRECSVGAGRVSEIGAFSTINLPSNDSTQLISVVCGDSVGCADAENVGLIGQCNVVKMNVDIYNQLPASSKMTRTEAMKVSHTTGRLHINKRQR